MTGGVPEVRDPPGIIDPLGATVMFQGLRLSLILLGFSSADVVTRVLLAALVIQFVIDGVRQSLVLG